MDKTIYKLTLRVSRKSSILLLKKKKKRGKRNRFEKEAALRLFTKLCRLYGKSDFDLRRLII